MKEPSVETKLDKLDYDILNHLLESHIEDGMYWGRQDYHYKRCQKLLAKIKEML